MSALGHRTNPVSIGRIAFLEAVRGIASLIVLLQHLFESWSPDYREWSGDWFNLGRVGITAFFLVSGYVVALTLSRQSIRVFVIRRFWRLYPIYWLISGLYFLQISLTGDSAEIGWMVAIANILMIQGFIGVMSVLGPAWTLGIEIVFYAQSVVSKRFGLIAYSALLGLVWLAFFGALAGLNAFTGGSFTSLAPLMMFTGAVGMAIYNIDAGATSVWLRIVVFASVVVLPLSYLLMGAGPIEGWSAFSFAVSYAGGFALFLGARALSNSRIPRWLIWLGSISYVLYLLHVPVIEIFLHSSPLQLWHVPVITGICLIASTALHQWVEKPLVRFGRFVSNRAPKRPTRGPSADDRLSAEVPRL
jgi:peptidoglycan/LPS O-acetylase OafA/YrhL